MFLFPVGILIVLLMGAIAVDLGNVWLQQRRLADAADSAVNDAVTYGIDQQRYRADGSIVLDPVRVGDVIAVSIAGQNLPAAASVGQAVIGATAAGDPTVEITITSRADFIFGRLVAGGGIDISATGVAVAVDQ